MNGNMYFKPAGELDETIVGNSKDGKTIVGNSTNMYFKSAGDLDNESDKAFTPFKNPQEMVDSFRPAGDLGETIVGNSKDEIEDYLLSVVSGKKEYENICGGGRTIVSFETLRDMVDSGYNIVSANYINSDMIEVEYQELGKNNNMGRGR